MGFGLSNRYGLWVMGEFGPFGREPTQLREFMGYHRYGLRQRQLYLPCRTDKKRHTHSGTSHDDDVSLISHNFETLKICQVHAVRVRVSVRVRDKCLFTRSVLLSLRSSASLVGLMVRVWVIYFPRAVACSGSD